MTEATVAIIGGSGFVGGELSRRFSDNFNVKVIDINPPQRPEDSVRYEQCDIRNYESVFKALAGTDIVVHAAIIQIPQINERRTLAYEVNIIGTQNICRAVEKSPGIKGMILASSWHTIGERELSGLIDESFGFRPDKVEDRARLYALSKIAQEAIVRFYDEDSEKIFGIIRMGTVLGERMPKQTAANTFIDKGLKGDPITPYKHTMYRPMLYVDIHDVCHAYEAFATGTLNGQISKTDNSLSHITNIYYPEPITILELATLVCNKIKHHTSGRINPRIEIIDSGLPSLFAEGDKKRIRTDISRAKTLLGIDHLVSPEESLEEIVRHRLKASATRSE